MDLTIVPFEPRPGGQAAFWNDWSSRLLFLEGGWGSGKTWIGARKLLAATIWNAIDHDASGRPKLTGINSVMVGPTYRSMNDFMFPAFEEACEDWGVGYKYISKESMYHLPAFGCSVRARTADRPDLITGWQVGAAWGDEPARWKEDRTDPKKDPFLQIMGRVRGPGKLHQLYFTYTNEGDSTRVYEEAHSTKEGRARYRARTADNPSVKDFYQFQLENLTAALADQYLEGGAAMIGGRLVYADQFNASDHQTTRAVCVRGRPLHITMDFNIDPGMHVYLGHYMDDMDIFVIAHEIHGPRMSVRAAAQEVAQWIARNGGMAAWPEVHVFGDATGKAEWPGTAESNYDILAQGFRHSNIGPVIFRVPDSNPLRVDRVNAVNIALRDMGGRVHIAINPSCVRLLDDLRRVRWAKDGKEMDKSNPLLTHASDAIGYWVHYLRPTRRYVTGVGGRVG